MNFDWWTLGLQAVNVAVLVWLLQRFFWRPVAAIIAERRAAAARILAEAQAQRDTAAAAVAAVEQIRTGFAAEREAILAAARAAAEHERAKALDAASQDVAAQRAAAQRALAREAEAARLAWTDHAARLAVDIAGRLLARLPPDATHAAFLDALVAEIGALPQATRQTIMVGHEPLQVFTAAALSPAEEAHCRARIATALGAAPHLAFAADPALIAGFELHGPQVAIQNSWRAELDRIRKDLADAERT